MNNKIRTLFIMIMVAVSAANKCAPESCGLKCCTREGTCGRFLGECREFAACMTDSDCGAIHLICLNERCAINPMVSSVANLVNEASRSNKIQDNLEGSQTDQYSKPALVLTKEKHLSPMQSVGASNPFSMLNASAPSTSRVIIVKQIRPSSVSTKTDVFQNGSNDFKIATNDLVSTIHIELVKALLESNRIQIPNTPIGVSLNTTRHNMTSDFRQYVRQNAMIFDDNDDDEATNGTKQNTAAPAFPSYVRQNAKIFDDIHNNHHHQDNVYDGFPQKKEMQHNQNYEAWKRQSKQETNQQENNHRHYNHHHSYNHDQQQHEQTEDYFYYEQSPLLTWTILGLTTFVLLLAAICRICASLHHYKRSLRELAEERFQNQQARGETHRTNSLNAHIQHLAYPQQNSNQAFYNSSSPQHSSYIQQLPHNPFNYQQNLTTSALPQIHPQFYYYQVPLNRDIPRITLPNSSELNSFSSFEIRNAPTIKPKKIYVNTEL